MDILSLHCRMIDLEKIVDILLRDLPEDHWLIRQATEALRYGGHDEISAAWAEVGELVREGSAPAARSDYH